jgi:hypothetical protein
MPQLNKLSPTASLPYVISQVNDAFSKIDGENLTKVIKDTTGTPRLIFGKLPDGEYGLVISKEGTDVLTVFD